ncbi:MAG: tRNA-dihydrouridine synthase family protein [Muribaculaceae bacterium]|nr:tRNA-dihydrouridine synthase family protein [Muribaculaceae bacterium]
MAEMLLMSAPLQGFTEAPFRAAHSLVCGGADEYFTPFVRFERGAVRGRDLRDACAATDRTCTATVVPQVIAADAAEFLAVTRALRQEGHRRIDLNMGCPFPPQVKHGRGAGLTACPERLSEIAAAMDPEVEWSVKMRLGTDDPRQWRQIVAVLNSMPLRHVAVHPRTARQQYGGQLHLEEFRDFLGECALPVVFNGDILAPCDIDAVVGRFPSVCGVMAGRGLLMRPSLFAEWRSGGEWDPERLRACVLALHDLILEQYESVLCGDAQVLMKILPLWEYLGHDFPAKAVKAIRKSRRLSDYRAGVAALRTVRTD